MKKMKIVFALLIATFAVACGQDNANNYIVPVTFNAGFRFTPTGPIIMSIPTGGGTADWNTLLNKPATFPSTWTTVSGKPTLFSGSYLDLTNKPTLFSGSYVDLTNKPTEIELQAAISSLPGFMLPKLTTAQINALTPVEGLEVYDLTLHVKKYWNGSLWKIVACTN